LVEKNIESDAFQESSTISTAQKKKLCPSCSKYLK
jgi:hypothetical protein